MKLLRCVISGISVNATPEEVDAVQPLASRLLALGYPAADIRVHPQYRLAKSPGSAESWPLDIAVMGARNVPDIICECKKKDRASGRTQLMQYLAASPATAIGIWSNGNEQLVLFKTGSSWSELEFIPHPGWTPTSIPTTAATLRVVQNLKGEFSRIYHWLSKQQSGVPASDSLCLQFITLLYCKIYDETRHSPFEFYAKVGESPRTTLLRIKRIHAEVSSIHPSMPPLVLMDVHVRFIVEALQWYDLVKCGRDVLADAVESFIPASHRAEKGQFFTPKNVVDLCIGIMGQRLVNSKVLDYACGSGGFLIEVLRAKWRMLASGPLGTAAKARRHSEIPVQEIFGWEKDPLLVAICKMYMMIIGDGSSNIIQKNSIEENSAGDFDLVISNPPYGKKIAVDDEEIIRKYSLGGSAEQVVPEILFFERALTCLKPNGKFCLVLPISLLAGPKTMATRQYIMHNAIIEGIVLLPSETFQPSTSVQTAVVWGHKIEGVPSQGRVYYAVANSCGHDKRGKAIKNDDLPLITADFNAATKTFGKMVELTAESWLLSSDPLPQGVALQTLASIIDGVEPGTRNYREKCTGTDVRFLRTTDMRSGFLPNATDNYVVTEYGENLQFGDILFTKDGRVGDVIFVLESCRVAFCKGIILIRPRNVQNAVEIYQSLKSGRNYFKSHATGAMIKHLDKRLVLNYPVSVTAGNSTDPSLTNLAKLIAAFRGKVF